MPTPYQNPRISMTPLLRMRKLLDRTYDGILLVELSVGTVVDFNASALRLTGRSVESLEGCPIDEVIGRVAWEELADMVHEGQTDPGIRRSTVVEMARHDGNAIVELSLGYHGFQDGLFGVVVLRDVTERERTLKELRSAHRRIRDLIEFLPDATLVLDASGRVIEWNRAMERLTGVSKDDMLGKGDMACSLPIYGRRTPLLAHGVLGLARELEQPSYDHFVQVGDSVEAAVFAPALRGGRGAHVWAVASALRGADGSVTGAIESVRDTTQQREAEEASKANARELHATLDSISDAIIASDASGRVSRMNPAAERMTGWSAVEVRGRPLEEVICLLTAANRLPVAQPGFHALRARGESTSSEDLILVPRRGPEVRVSSRGAPILDEQGGILGIVMVLRDVTEQRVFEQKLALTQRMESLGRLAGGIAHDFNNILAVIRGFADIIAEEMDESSPFCEDIAEIRAAAERGTQLSRRLLAFGKQDVAESRTVDLHEMINGASRMLGRVIREDIDVRTVLSARRPCVLGDPAQLEQVLMNLVVNARDAMPTGGTLTISTADVDLSEHQEATVEQIARWVRITVRDSGIGMSPEVLDHVFEPFFTTKAPESGTGIGLSITYGIVRQHGGTIRVDSEKGKGTSFEIDLPSVNCDGAGQPVSSTRPAARAAGATVLVVEDEPVLRRLISRILGKYGYLVISAADGVEALAKAEAHSGTIDLVVTDVVMPRMGGVEMARAIQAARPGMKTLFVSGYSTDEMVQRGMAADAPGFLAKPFTPARFAKKVQELLAQNVPDPEGSDGRRDS